MIKLREKLIDCRCGKQITAGNLAQHRKTEIHKKLICT